ncbi:MAG: hypothetical protein WAO91_06105 [Candidatus Nitrosotenuis sp.]
MKKVQFVGIVLAVLLVSSISTHLAFAEDDKIKKKPKKIKEKHKLKKEKQFKPVPKKENSIKQKQVKPKIVTPPQPQTQSLDLTSNNWKGTAQWSVSFEYYDAELGTYTEKCEFLGNIQMNLVQNGNTITGNLGLSNVELVSAIRANVCNNPNFASFGGGVVNAQMFGSNFSGSVGIVNLSGSATTDLLNGKLSLSDNIVQVSGTFSAQRAFN